MTNGHFCKTAEKSETKKRSCYERLIRMKNPIRMDDLVKKERKIVQNLAISWLFLRKILATLARISLQIGYFELPTDSWEHCACDNLRGKTNI